MNMKNKDRQPHRVLLQVFIKAEHTAWGAKGANGLKYREC